MPQLWDVVIVGAGPAGSAAAYDLAAAGRRVLLVDRATFPRAKACAGGLTMKAVKALRYPIDPVVRTWVRDIVLEEKPGSQVRVGRKAPVCAMTVREELDLFCLEKTLARGAAFLQIPAITAIVQQDDRVVMSLGDGTTIEARYLLGADGVHSRVRALATDGRWFRAGFAVEANVPYRDEGAKHETADSYPLTFDFGAVSRGYGWLFPRDTHVNVGLYVEATGPSSRLDRAALDRYIAARCGPARSYGKPVGQFLGLGAAGYTPEPATRVLLAGDAAGFVDPLTGEGIYGAIRSGQAPHWQAAGGPAVKLATHPSAAEGFLTAAASLQSDLRVAEHAASSFFADPGRGFRLMRLPLVTRAVLRAYTEGLSLGGLLRGVRTAARRAGW